ncbi:MAG: (5-formylfuran-3-yl)methyl phosphate synthase [Hyphomicrobiales bacterium]
MIAFLASVTGPAEAEIALSGGADIIDLKDPSHGALAAVDPSVVAATRAAVGTRAKVSAVTGDVAMRAETLTQAIARYAATGCDFLKVGLFPDPQILDCVRALAPLARETKLVGVLFADLSPDLGLLVHLKQAGFHGAMLDTAKKGGGRLTTHLGAEQLSRFVARCRELGLTSGLAGGLEAPDVPRLLPLKPDVMGFRGALCGKSGRAGTLDPEAIAEIRGLIGRGDGALEPAADDPPVNYEVLAARGNYRSTEQDRTAVDQIFVRDFVLPIEIGAYSHERGRQQRVRFDVWADVRRKTPDRDDMRHIFSYDVITDAIRTVVAEGPLQLVETLAERIAGRLLEHPGLLKVRVRVEKLDVGPGGVGVEIVRERAASAASIHRLRDAVGEPRA